VIFIGNSIFGDDSIGLVVGGILRRRLEELGFGVQIIERTGFALLDCLDGCDTAVVVDSVCTERNLVGEVLSLSAEDFRSVKSAAPHFSGVPETMQLMRELRMNLPKVSIVGISVKDPYTLSDNISDDLKQVTDAISREVFARILASAGAGVNA
jgi:hydrogenase maturation protease